MSTARTAHGCLVEDYPIEVRTVCQTYVDTLRHLQDSALPVEAVRARDVAISLIRAIDQVHPPLTEIQRNAVKGT